MSCKKVFQMAGIMVALCFCFLQTARADGLITVREGPTVQGSTRSQDCANSWNASALQASSYTVAPYQNFNLYWCDPSYSSGGMTCSVEYFEIWVDAGAGYYLLYGGISPSVFQFTLAFTGTGTAQFFVRAYGGCVALRGVRAWPFDGLDSNVITIVCSTSSLSCASNPNPSSGAMGVSTSPTLSWPSVSGATSYDVYFGAGSSPPYVTNITGTSYSPGTLNQNTTYYWGVAPRNSGGSAGGCPVWSFMTTGGSGGCSANATTLCLNGNRFRVTVTWKDYTNNTGSGTVVPYQTSDSGLFWFFTSTNWEMMVAVLNGCGYNGNYWVYAAAKTDVEYHLIVTDTSNGQTKEYDNTLGTRSPAITDDTAFATCP